MTARRTHLGTGLLLASVLLLAGSRDVRAQYRWTDERGITHESPTRDKVPARYRDSATRYQSRGPSRDVPLSPVQGALFVNATIRGRHKKLSGRMLVDTGATYCVIGREHAEALRIKPDEGRTLPIQTANGIVNGRLITLRSVKVEHVEARDVQTVVLDVNPGPGIVGIVGLSYLNRFRYSIDPRAGKLRLRR